MREYKNVLWRQRVRFAIAGIAHALSSERSLKTQGMLFTLAVLALIVLRPTPVWWALVLEAGGCVLTAELFNTALERLADHLHPELHPQIRIVKDCAAGAVLVAAIVSLAVAAALISELLRRA